VWSAVGVSLPGPSGQSRRFHILSRGGRSEPLKFSVVVPSLNQGQFLETCLKSILGQAGDFEIECIVMDGGSTDESVAILERLERSGQTPSRSLHWSSGPDGGQSDAINSGFSLATGDLLAYLNCDDRYITGALELVHEAFSRNPDAQWLTGYCRVVDTYGSEIQRGVTAYRNFWLRRYSFTAIRALNFIAQPATFWRRSAAERVGTFDESLSYTMDYDYWLRVSALGAPMLLREYLAEFRIHDQSKGATAYVKQFREDYQTFLRTSPGAALRLFHRLHNAAVVSAYRILK